MNKKEIEQSNEEDKDWRRKKIIKERERERERRTCIRGDSAKSGGGGIRLKQRKACKIREKANYQATTRGRSLEYARSEQRIAHTKIQITENKNNKEKEMNKEEAQRTRRTSDCK